MPSPNDNHAPPGRVLICANPYSGAGPNRRYVQGLVRALRKRALEAVVVWDADERCAMLSDPGLPAGYRCVVVAGGDGSIHAVVNELARAGHLERQPSRPTLTFATLPMGNENLFASCFGFTRDVQLLAHHISEGETIPMDLGVVEYPVDAHERAEGSETKTDRFTLMVGAGFDAEVVHRVARWRQAGERLRRIRRASYVRHILAGVSAYAGRRFEVSIDGRSAAGTSLFVFNLSAYGGGLKIAPPGCSAEDGRLDYVLFDQPGRRALVASAWSVLRARHLARSDVVYGQASSIEVRGFADQAGSDARQLPLQADGDPAGFAPVRIGIDQICKLPVIRVAG
ncbi:MAG: hypothetical protein Kow00105_09490 [Phycisphaeraceae bacterium]